mgnify:CR=1 FL=1
MEYLKRKKTLILLMIIVVIIIISIVVALLLLTTSNNGEVANNNTVSEENNNETEAEPQINESKYYNITNVVRTYLGALDKSKYILSDGTNYSEDESTKESIYNLLSTEYIESNNITVENVYDYVKDVNENITFVPLDMRISQGQNVDKFLVYGNIVYMDSQDLEKVYVIVNIDNTNNTFSIEPINSEEISNINDFKFESTLNTIEKNYSNTYLNNNMSDEDISKEKFNNFKLLILRKSEDLFNLLNEEYRNKKFGDYNGFSQYIDSNYDRLRTINLSMYQVTEEDGYKQYVLLDQDDRYYIFKETSENKEEIFLDTYTVDLPEFLDRYNGADDEYKVGYNVEKFISAINDGDYKYAYNLLDETFRRNNYPSQGDFENFVKTNFFENNEIQHNNVEKQGNQFVYGITIINKDNESERKNITVIMELGEETDFVMSFSIDE